MYDVTRRRLESLSGPRPPERPGMHPVALHRLMFHQNKLEQSGLLDAEVGNGSRMLFTDQHILQAVTTSIELKAQARLGSWSICGFKVVYAASLND